MKTPYLSPTILNSTHPALIQHNIPLADKNWFKTGGCARFYAEPTTAQELQAAVVFAQQFNLPIFMLGEGANILISDHGFDGLVIKPALKTISHRIINDDTAEVTAEAGVSMANLIDYCLAQNLLGLEEFSGIPGTVGGSVYINLHYFEFLLAQFLVTAQVLNRTTNAIEVVDNAWFNFGYDESKLHAEEYYLVNATFCVRGGSDLEIAFAKGRQKEIIRHRASRYPTKNTCGSFFRNFHDHEVTLESNGKKMIYVAYYLDKIGVKGQLSIGNAIVSYQHANMLVNKGNATSSDLIQVARRMQELVHEQYGIVPQPECRLVGFSEYPLHKI